MNNLPEIRKRNHGWELVVDNKPFIMFSGEAHNSSASSLQYMNDKVWDAVVELNCNSLIVPVYWELFEPEEEVFDFSLIDGLIKQAGERSIKLVLLWFASWKNSYSPYVPEWVKTDTARFFRMETPEGKKMARISYFCDEAKKADARAFTVLMKRIKEVDSEEHTVLMVQLQNEVGILGADRDYSAVAENEFQSSVPHELMQGLLARKEKLRPELAEAWMKNGSRQEGLWKEIFGDLAEEVFSAWHFARYIEYGAVAGAAEFPLPMFVNAWLVQNENQPAGEYPSGGPVSKMIDIWEIAAPTSCLTAPDIYLDDFAGVCTDYTTPDNPLLIPEARRDETAAANVFYAIGKHQALCFAPFGIESMVSNAHVDIVGNTVADASFNIRNFDNGKMLAEAYSILQNMQTLISDCYGTENMTAFLQQEKTAKENISFGGYNFEIEYTNPYAKGQTPGAGLIIDKDGEFFIAGHGFMIVPVTTDEYIEIVLLEEGRFNDGQWQMYRRLNGDECRCILPETPAIRRLKLFKFQ